MAAAVCNSGEDKNRINWGNKNKMNQKLDLFFLFSVFNANLLAGILAGSKRRIIKMVSRSESSQNKINLIDTETFEFIAPYNVSAT